ncbi:Cupredoxin [Cynara cardunculus var. scolymus]|uniref:Cupredoxin n=1 Tax=Cynara cardunculus var. scolymus TaxID=59895 RepID=A0A124SBB5_CYNCS|nr:Cupredoxin [Cynara cardunculus var. scolymus]
MATNKWSIIFLLAMIASLATSVLATSIAGKSFIVGDDKGWTLNVDYQAWANGKKFCVGDELVFKYPVGKHNVLSVNETSFQKCIISPTSEPLSTGEDLITLDTPGKKFFICAIGKHCELGGLKLCIDVLPQSKPPGPPATGKEIMQCIIPPPDANQALISGYDIVTVETPGKECFICGIGKHCELGMKLCVNVHPAPVPASPLLQGTRKLATTKNLGSK